jgi:hypothetical protein
MLANLSAFKKSIAFISTNWHQSEVWFAKPVGAKMTNMRSIAASVVEGSSDNQMIPSP